MTGVTPPRRSLGHIAEAYASRGIKVFPLWNAINGVCTCSDGPECSSPAKHPRIPRGVNRATNETAQVELWWACWPEANIGLPAGDNSLAVLDVDPYHNGLDALATLAEWCQRRGVNLLDTRTIRTGSGGLHLYFREPAGGIKSTARAFGADGLDTRGRGGYVVAPPSVHASGEAYTVVRDVELQPWPALLTDLMDYRPTTAAPQAAGTPPRGAMGNGERWARAGLQRECEALAAMTVKGGRNDALNVAAYKVGRRVGAGLLAEDEAARDLYAACAGWHDTTERELRGTIASGLRAGMARPHEGPRRGQV